MWSERAHMRVPNSILVPGVEAYGAIHRSGQEVIERVFDRCVG